MPPNWPELRRRILVRDGGRCRYCGHPAEGDQINHVIPRRIAGAGAHLPSNLVLLCSPHHAEFTHRAEALLFRGKPWEWFRWVGVFERSGQVPGGLEVAAAFERLRKMLDRE